MISLDVPEILIIILLAAWIGLAINQYRHVHHHHR